MALDFISGKHVVSMVRYNGKLWAVKVKSTKVQELGEVVLDQVNGENRARFQKLTDGYSVTLDCYEDGSSSILENYLFNQANEDANQQQVNQNVGIRFNYLDGSAGAWVFTGCTLNPLNFEAAGRKDRVNHTVAFHCQYFQQVPAVGAAVSLP
jgi:hypothetical protein